MNLFFEGRQAVGDDGHWFELGGEENEGVILSTPSGDRAGGCGGGGDGDCGRTWWDF